MDDRPGDSFLWTCRSAYFEGRHPFDEKVGEGELYHKLAALSGRFELSDFTGFLMEGQYYINLWAAILILEKFRPEIESKLIGLNDNKSIVEDCFETIDRYSSTLNSKTQTDHYLDWIQGIKTHYDLN